MGAEPDEILTSLRGLRNKDNIRGMARFGITSKKVLGISMPDLKIMAKKIGKDHKLARSLWGSGIHEARILAGLIEDPSRVSEEQTERWAAVFDNRAVCDGIRLHLFRRTPHAYEKMSPVDPEGGGVREEGRIPANCNPCCQRSEGTRYQIH